MLHYRQDILSKSMRIFRMFADFRPIDKILKNEKVWFLSEKFKLTCVCACVSVYVFGPTWSTHAILPWLNFVKMYFHTPCTQCNTACSVGSHSFRIPLFRTKKCSRSKFLDGRTVIRFFSFLLNLVKRSTSTIW